MRCDEYEVLISVYADGELDGKGKADLEAHIATCPGCRRFYDETVELQRGLTAALTHCPAVPDLVSTVADQVQTKQGFKLAWRWAAAAAVLIVISSYAFLRSPADVKPDRPGVVYPPPPPNVVKYQQPPAVKQQEQHRVYVEKRPSTSAPLPGPKAPVKQPGKPFIHPLREKEHLAVNEPEVPDMCVEVAEVMVEYTDGVNAAGYARDLLAPPVSPVIGAGSGQQVVAETEVITENGARTERVCYRIVDRSEDAPKEPDQGE